VREGTLGVMNMLVSEGMGMPSGCYNSFTDTDSERECTKGYEHTGE
jgi:hypothetical protein